MHVAMVRTETCIRAAIVKDRPKAFDYLPIADAIA
jgi:hypothetical protein